MCIVGITYSCAAYGLARGRSTVLRRQWFKRVGRVSFVDSEYYYIIQTFSDYMAQLNLSSGNFEQRGYTSMYVRL